MGWRLLWVRGNWVYMLMPQKWMRVERELRPHGAVLAAILAGTAVLLAWPHLVLGAGYECVLHGLFGIRCPFCGMTRDFAAMLHGQRPGENPCSWVAAAVVYGVYPAAVAWAWRRKRLDVFYSRTLRYGAGVMLAAMLVVNNLR